MWFSLYHKIVTSLYRMLSGSFFKGPMSFYVLSTEGYTDIKSSSIHHTNADNGLNNSFFTNNSKLNLYHNHNCLRDCETNRNLNTIFYVPFLINETIKSLYAKQFSTILTVLNPTKGENSYAVNHKTAISGQRH